MVFNLFIINDEVIFDANSYELKSLINLGDVILLNAPTSRCLQLLIEKKDVVVSRENFLEQVWLARGIVVSQNTFYQNISLLRKSLKKIGLTEDIIITVRRKGFILAPHTRIQPVDDQQITLQGNSSPDLAIESSSLLEPGVASTTITETTLPSSDSKAKIPKWLIFLLVFFIILEITSLISNWLNK